MGVVLEEADETVFWLEALAEAGVVKPGLLEPLLKEANEPVAIFAASQSTAKSGLSVLRADDPMTRSPDDPMSQ